jgi:hypothetical protein
VFAAPTEGEAGCPGQTGCHEHQVHQQTERDRLLGEPAYGNLAELGLGVLADFGVEPF